MEQGQTRDADSDKGPRTIHRDHPGRMWLGVGAALAGAFQLPVVIVRLAFFILTFWHGLGLMVYLLAAAFIPRHAGENSFVERTIITARRFADDFRGSASPAASHEGHPGAEKEA